MSLTDSLTSEDDVIMTVQFSLFCFSILFRNDSEEFSLLGSLVATYQMIVVFLLPVILMTSSYYKVSFIFLILRIRLKGLFHGVIKKISFNYFKVLSSEPVNTMLN
jgi:hypothetical protein